MCNIFSQKCVLIKIMLVDFRRILTKCDITTAFKGKMVDKL